jgi:hypothetical protein
LLSTSLLAAVSIVCLAASGAVAPASESADGVAFFEQSVRPLLVSRCYECHATTARKVKGNLLLDSKAGWEKGGELGPVILPGAPDRSLLIQAVNYEHGDLKMPPKGKLPQAEIDALVRWVKMGAPDPRAGPAVSAPAPKQGINLEEGKKHWSLQPLNRAGAPAVNNAAWCTTPVDRFVLAKLEEKRIAPNAVAERRKLIRRAYFDLVGLPPPPDEVEAFVADPDPVAYEKLVDRLLASPRYGERWASYWLDVTRFAESDGFEHDYDRPYAYHFRDFVIRALNDDLPYDKFAKWQVAGDEYEPDNPLAMMATGFLTAGVFPTQITEKEFESTRYNQLDDMVATTGVAFLGLTVGCARCHDHKFDPIPAVDYYRLASTFTTAVHADVELDLSTPQEREQAGRQYQTRRAELTAKVHDFEREVLPRRFDEYLAAVKQHGGVTADAWSVLDVTGVDTRGTKFAKLPDGSLLKTGGETPAKDTYTFTARTGATGITALRIEALSHESLPKYGPGLAPNGNFVLGAIEILAAPADGSAKPVELNVVKATATHEQDHGGLSVAATLDEDPKTGWAVDNGGIGKDQAAVFQLDRPAGFAGGTVLTVRMRFEHPNKQHAIGRPRLSVTTDLPVPPVRTGSAVDSVPPPAAMALNALLQSERPDPAQQEAARRWFLGTLPEYQKLTTDLAALEGTGPARRVVKVQVTTEGLPPVKNHADERGYPHFYPQTYVLKRGDPNQKVEPATQSFLQVLMRDGATASRWQSPPPPGARTSFRRRALAEWLTDVDHGAGALAARVAVNRLWQHHFGRGIVATPSDFGTRGAPPTHPELLDYLASQLVEGGWRLKPLHRLIMLSSAYQTAGTYDPDKAAVDPDNHLLWRRNMRRLEAEAVRDSMLSVAGLLDTTMYGPGTLAPASRRRSTYFTIKRSSLVPMMVVFDAPEALTPMGDRSTTTIAPQALLLMNNPQVRGYAKALAKRAAPASGPATEEGIVRNAYAIALSRQPTTEEVSDATAFMAAQADGYARAGRADARELARADFCQALMCLNEFVYVE